MKIRLSVFVLFNSYIRNYIILYKEILKYQVNKTNFCNFSFGVGKCEKKIMINC